MPDQAATPRTAYRPSQPLPATTAAYLATFPDRDRPTMPGREWAAMMKRHIRSGEGNSFIDPADYLPHMADVMEYMRESVNASTAVTADMYAADPVTAPSLGEVAAAWGVNRSVMTGRRARGLNIITERLAAWSVIVLDNYRAKTVQAVHERQQTDATADAAVTALAGYRARHAARDAA